MLPQMFQTIYLSVNVEAFFFSYIFNSTIYNWIASQWGRENSDSDGEIPHWFKEKGESHLSSLEESYGKNFFHHLTSEMKWWCLLYLF